MSRGPFVHEVELVLDESVDSAEPGAAVTVALCGHWEHEGPCRWPHNNQLDTSGAPARFRTVFAADAADEAEVRSRIDEALAGDDRWSVRSSGKRPLAPDELELGDRLATGPRA